MDKIKEVVNNPALLEEKLKEYFNKVDVDKKGYISHEALKQALENTAKELNLPKPEREPTEEEKEKAKKLLIQMELEKLLLNLLELCHWQQSKKERKEVNFNYLDI